METIYFTCTLSANLKVFYRSLNFLGSLSKVFSLRFQQNSPSLSLTFKILINQPFHKLNPPLYSKTSSKKKKSEFSTKNQATRKTRHLTRQRAARASKLNEFPLSRGIRSICGRPLTWIRARTRKYVYTRAREERQSSSSSSPAYLSRDYIRSGVF